MTILEKMFVIVSVYLISLIGGVYNFNFDTKFPIVYKNPGHKNSLFGYSVILYEGDGKGTPPWIQIGAPKYHNPSDYESGHVYRCGIIDTCNLLNMPIVLQVPGSSLGHTMDLSPNGEVFAVCGHRYIQISVGVSDYYSKGFCHWGNTNENRTEQRIPFHDSSATTDRSNGDNKPTTTIYAYGNGQAGFSLQFANTNSGSPSVILGAPGVYNWGGTPLLWNAEGGGVGAARRRKRSNNYQFQKFLIPSGSIKSDLSLFGYSVTSGYFVDKKTLQYAAGAPRLDMIGEVQLFEFIGNAIKTIESPFRGEQFGEYYGGSLASADLNGDGYSDLIVGAPTFKGAKYNEGKIYIYYGGEFKERSAVVGKQTGAQFGDTVASLGDINYDGYDDIAVAATYSEDGAGTVFIYRGSHEGIVLNMPQTIRGKDYVSTIKGFGHSIARPRDIDGNKYKDLAIGAYRSEQAFIFRARPVVTLKHKFMTENIRVNHGAKSFDLTFSVKYTTNQEFGEVKLTLIPEFKIDLLYGRAYLSQAPEKIVLEGPGRETSKTYNIQLKENITNIYEPINYMLNFTLEELETDSNMIVIDKNGTTGKDGFCKNCPVFDPTTKRYATGIASFNLDCGDKNKCHSKLHMKTSFKDIDEGSNSVFIIGSKQFLTLETEVSNTGDKAYLTQLSINLPSKPKVSLRKQPSTCKWEDTNVVCAIANPLEKDAKKTVELELDMTEVNEGTNADLSFDISVSTISENSEQSSQVVLLLAKKRASIKITGRSKEEYYTFDNTSSVVEFAQVLQVQKEGPSSLDNVLIEVEVPVAYDTNSFIEMYQPTLALKGQTIKCKGASFDFIEKKSPNYAESSDYASRSRRRRRNAAEDVTQKFQHFTGFYINCSNDEQISNGLKCEKIQCDTGSINRDVVEIQLKFRLNIGNIPQNILGESDVIIFNTNYDAIINDTALTESEIHRSQVMLSSVLVGPNVEKMVPIWIIIVAVLCGVLVLAVIAAVLYKFGFFERKKKDLLKEEMNAELATGATNLEDDGEEE